MKEYFDTPLIVFACANAKELGSLSRHLLANAGEAFTTPHALAECFNTLTYKLGISPREAGRLITANTARITFVRLNEDDYLAAINRVLSSGATGDKVYDALHLQAAEKCGADKIHTSNARDFSILKTSISVERLALPVPPGR